MMANLKKAAWMGSKWLMQAIRSVCIEPSRAYAPDDDPHHWMLSSLRRLRDCASARHSFSQSLQLEMVSMRFGF